ncbi:unnamed protein product, partial [Coregonus sp. 'balchen']
AQSEERECAFIDQQQQYEEQHGGGGGGGRAGAGGGGGAVAGLTSGTSRSAMTTVAWLRPLRLRFRMGRIAQPLCKATLQLNHT